MKVAIVHYWFVTWRGGEKVVEQLLKLFPDADIYTHVITPEIQSRWLSGSRVYTTFVSRLPRAAKLYQKYLPLMPLALEQLDLTGYDLVISSESGPAKNVLIGPDSLHICYCHSPMRYVWDMYNLYLSAAGRLTRLLMRPIMHYMRVLDSISASRVDYFIANSSFVARRIEKCYRRTATVIHPPVDTDAFSCQSEKDDYYLMLGQLTEYKRADLVFDCFVRSGRKLIVIGEGEQLERLRSSAPSNIQVLGRQPFAVVKRHLANAKALVFPGIEDFGIVPLEAMASGTPVIAYAKGGALETVIDIGQGDSATGVLFHEQTMESLENAIERFEELDNGISAAACRERALQFSSDRFRREIRAFLDDRISQTKIAMER